MYPGPFGRILVGDLRLGIEDLQHALGRGRRLLARRDDVAHGLDRPDELQRQRDERHQAAEGQRMGADRDRAEHDDQADDGVRDQVEQRPERAEQARLLDLGPAHLGGLGVVPGRGLPSAAERLQHPDPGGRLLDQRGQVALLVLDPAGQHPVALLEPEADRQHRREHHAGDQAQPPVEVDQQRDDRDERHDVGDQEDQAEAGEPADRRQVGGGPRQELARLPVVMEGRLQPLQVGVQVVPDRLLDVRDRAGLDPAADHVQQPLGCAEADRRQGQRDQQALVAMSDRAVDHGLGQERDDNLGGDRAERGGEHHDHLRAIRLQVAA